MPATACTLDDNDAVERGLRQLDRLATAFRVEIASRRRPHRADAQFRFAGLDVTETLGAGGQGDVWRAFDPGLRTAVALKLRPSGTQGFADPILAEARRLVRVNHPNVVRVFGTASEDGRSGFWMEAIDGESLQARLQREGALPARDAIAFGVTLCDALAAVHAQGLVHGDVKPGNVLVSERGRIVLIDFGSARDIGAPLATTVTGTRAYAAPEVLAGALPAVAGDVYALGMTLWVCLGGMADDASRGRHRLRGQHDVPWDLLALIERAVSDDVRRRPGSMREFSEALGGMFRD